MADSGNSAASIGRKTNSNKWSAEQLQALMDIVSQLIPNSSEGWREVCMRMHGMNSRRRPSDYKAKYMSEKAKEQIITCQQNNKITNDIYFWFHQGKSSQQISELLRKVNSKTVETVLHRTIGNINKIIPKIVGSSKHRPLKMKDHRFFGSMMSQGVKIQRIDKIQFDCLCWRQLNKPKSQFKKQNPEKYRQIKYQLQKKIYHFNQRIKQYQMKQELKYNVVFEDDHLDNSSDKSKFKQIKPEQTRSSALSSFYLKAISQAPENFRQSAPLFSDETLQKMHEQLDHSLKITSCKTFDEQQYSNTRNTLLFMDKEQNQANQDEKKDLRIFDEEKFFSFSNFYHGKILAE